MIKLSKEAQARVDRLLEQIATAIERSESAEESDVMGSHMLNLAASIAMGAVQSENGTIAQGRQCWGKVCGRAWRAAEKLAEECDVAEAAAKAEGANAPGGRA
jgi:hypothetical protein